VFDVRGVQCLVMGELRQIKILRVKSLIVASLALEHKQFHKALVGTSVKV